MRNIHELVHLGYPSSWPPPRAKATWGMRTTSTSRRERDVASAAEALLACELGAAVVRTHNVEKTAEGLADLRPLRAVGDGFERRVGGGAR